MLRLLAQRWGWLQPAGKSDQACVPTLRDIAQSAQPEPLWIPSGLCAETTLCGGIDATRALAARSVVGSRGAGDCSAARRSANRSIARARIRQPRLNQSDRADDVAVVPADAYEYRHLLSVAQPWNYSSTATTPLRTSCRTRVRSKPFPCWTEKRALRHVSSPTARPTV